MFAVAPLTTQDLKDVADLEASVYPEDMCLGYQDYVSDFRRCKTNLSFGVRLNGRLVGYIVAYIHKYHSKGQAYVSDLVCLNPRALIPLLKSFSDICDNIHFEAEFRETSYRMITKLSERYPDVVKITSETVIPEYWEGEAAYKVRFTVNKLKSGQQAA